MSRDVRILISVIALLVLANLVVGLVWHERAKPAREDAELRTLRIAVWEDYLAPALLDRFARTERCRIEITIFDSNEELLRLLSEEDARFDIIVPSSYIIPRLISIRAVDKLDRSLLTNEEMIDDSIDSLAVQGEDAAASSVRISEYGVPFVVAQTGVAASTNSGIPIDELRTWQVFGREDLRGKATLLHDMRETFAAALLATGRGVNETRKDALENARRLIERWLTVATFNDDSYAADLPADRLTVAHAYPGDVGHILGGPRQIQFLVPDEGGSISIEYMCVVRESGSPGLSRRFVDFMLDPTNAIQNMMWSHIRTASAVAYKQFVESLEGKPNPIPSTLETIPRDLVLRPLSDADHEKYELLWRTLSTKDSEP